MRIIWKLFTALLTISLLGYLVKIKAMEIEVLGFKKMPETDPNFMDFGTLRLKKKGRNRFAFEGDFELFQNFGSELEMVIEMKNGKGNTLMKTVQKLCDFMKNDKMAWPGIQKHSNMSERCPVLKGVYSVKNYEYNANDLPPIFPPGVYYALTYATDKTKIKFGWSTDFELKR